MTPWEADDRPTDRDDLPPGFYFPPDQKAAPAPSAVPRTRWVLVILVVLLVVAVGVAAFAFV